MKKGYLSNDNILESIEYGGLLHDLKPPSLSSIVNYLIDDLYFTFQTSGKKEITTENLDSAYIACSKIANIIEQIKDRM